MADSTFEQTGVDQLRQAIDKFPAAVTARLRAVASAAATRVRDRAQTTLRDQQKTEAHALADNITIEEDAPNKQFLVISRPPIGQGTNLPIWNEHGTVKMPARPYMRPAAAAETSRYQNECQAAAEQAALEIFGD